MINSGGVICVGYEYFRKAGYNPQEFNIERGAMVAHVERIGKTVSDIIKTAQEQSKPTGETADKLAEDRFLKGVTLNDNDEDSSAEDQANSDSNGGTRLVQ